MSKEKGIISFRTKRGGSEVLLAVELVDQLKDLLVMDSTKLVYYGNESTDCDTVTYHIFYNSSEEVNIGDIFKNHNFFKHISNIAKLEEPYDVSGAVEDGTYTVNNLIKTFDLMFVKLNVESKEITTNYSLGKAELIDKLGLKLGVFNYFNLQELTEVLNCILDGHNINEVSAVLPHLGDCITTISCAFHLKNIDTTDMCHLVKEIKKLFQI